jgi:hypothetical protein
MMPWASYIIIDYMHIEKIEKSKINETHKN